MPFPHLQPLAANAAKDRAPPAASRNWASCELNTCIISSHPRPIRELIAHSSPLTAPLDSIAAVEPILVPIEPQTYIHNLNSYGNMPINQLNYRALQSDASLIAHDIFEHIEPRFHDFNRLNYLDQYNSHASTTANLSDLRDFSQSRRMVYQPACQQTSLSVCRLYPLRSHPLRCSSPSS
jgi:hypothetical protein